MILKESRGQNPNITHTLVNLQTMTTFNTDLLDQQLNFSTLQDDEVQEVYGGLMSLHLLDRPELQGMRKRHGRENAIC